MKTTDDSALPGPTDFYWIQGTDPFEIGRPAFRRNTNEISEQMDITWDVPVRMRDGVTIYVDIFRPTRAENPVPVIFTFSPYGKHGPKTLALFPGSGVPTGSVSSYSVWEGPDPVVWTNMGYAVVNGDCRGSWGTEGELEILGRQECRDGYDTIEWVAALPWCNGKVAMMGVSYLAVIQWGIAALNPPHLACFVPWEGFSDVYRDYSYHGGIPETNFVHFTAWSCRAGLNKVEDWVRNHREHHLYDEYFKSKGAEDLSRIQAPFYAVADWGDHGLHTRGCLNAWTEAGSEQKWLEVHGQKKWQYFYCEESVQRQRAFLDKFLLDRNTEVSTWPRVRIEVRDRAGKGVWRDENEWPLSRTTFITKHLDGASGQLTNDAVAGQSIVSYNPTVEGDNATFSYTFSESTELTGGMRLRLWVSTGRGDDMDLFVELNKTDRDGKTAPFVSFSMYDDGPLALGWLRVSHREIDIQQSTLGRPFHKHGRELLLRLNEIVPVDVEILPSSTRFQAGEKLKLSIQGNDAFRREGSNAVQKHEQTRNVGRHFIYTGGLLDSYIVLPIIPEQ